MPKIQRNVEMVPNQKHQDHFTSSDRSWVDMRDPVYVVLGTHRGGTSVGSKGLDALGVSLGDNLMAGESGNNERGFWEDLDIVKFNDELLDAFDASWHSIKILDEHLTDSAVFPDLVAKGQALIAQKVAAFTPYGFKDPRTARLLFYWQQVFQTLNLEPRYIIVLRDPLSVAQSLEARDRFPVEKSHLLWLQHMLAAMHWSHGHSRIVVDYNRLLADPRAELGRVRKALHMRPADPKGYQGIQGVSFVRASAFPI